MVDKKTKENWETFESWIPSDSYMYGGMTESVTVQGELFDPDQELKEKYPALKKAWKQYQIIKKLCEAKENETR
jgi:hypothetical protein|tara:strand:+ start:1597 stop:1818 length:222 start_codon:yes stop_codon:yes gene_type:complete